MPPAILRPPRFRALEYFCLLYDVAVDQEDYNDPWCAIGGASSSSVRLDQVVQVHRTSDDCVAPWDRDRYSLELALTPSPSLSGMRVWLGRPPSDLERGLIDSVALEPLRQNPRIEDCGDDQAVDGLWEKLLIAKLCRALLQAEGSTPAAAALDQVGLALVREAPLPDRRDASALGAQLGILRWLYLNEASACYHGHHSIALADDCLRYVKDEAGIGASPHELVALYNKAQGVLHGRDYVAALDRFRDLSGFLLESNTEKYFDVLSKNPYGWPKCRRLFDIYLRVPSILQAAETLITLRRSTDAERELGKLTRIRMTKYQQARAQIALAKIANDLGGQRLRADEFDWRNHSCANKKGIALQALGVEAERHAIRLRYRARLVSGGGSAEEGGPCPV